MPSRGSKDFVSKGGDFGEDGRRRVADSGSKALIDQQPIATKIYEYETLSCYS